jgi:hypothetical protein
MIVPKKESPVKWKCGSQRAGARGIFAKFLRATTRLAPTFHVEQTQHVGATLVVALLATISRNFSGWLGVVTLVSFALTIAAGWLGGLLGSRAR